MPADRVVSQGRRIFRLSGDRTIRNKPKLDQCLESITYSKHQSVTFIQQLLHSFFHLCVLKCRGEKLRRSVRLIACTEPSREHDDLRSADRLLKYLHRINNIRRTHIPEYLYDRLRTCPLKCPRTVIFTICSRENRDKYRRLCDLMRTDTDLFRVVKPCLYFLTLSKSPGIRCKYTLQRFAPYLFRFGKRNLYIFVRKYRLI